MGSILVVYLAGASMSVTAEADVGVTISVARVSKATATTTEASRYSALWEKFSLGSSWSAYRNSPDMST